MACIDLAEHRSAPAGGVRAIESTEPIARMHLEVWVELAESGQMIGARDCWIATTALVHGMSLATGNAEEFRRVPGAAGHHACRLKCSAAFAS